MLLGRLRAKLSDFIDVQVDRALGKLMRRVYGPVMFRRFDMLVLDRWERKAERSANPLLRAGAKYYSQNDEDGIVLEIVRRLGLPPGSFVEIGVGNGLENNTLTLLMHGWRGLWIGGEELCADTTGSTRLRFVKKWVAPDTIVTDVTAGLAALQLRADALDVLSVDIDSFDLHVVERLLAGGVRPALLIVEYNGKFPPPVEFSLAPADSWEPGNDFSSCSLQSWWNLLVPAGYRLVVCNVTGVNAFFVRAEHAALFADVPERIEELFMPCDYNWFVQTGHKPSPRTLQRFL